MNESSKFRPCNQGATLPCLPPPQFCEETTHPTAHHVNTRVPLPNSLHLVASKPGPLQDIAMDQLNHVSAAVDEVIFRGQAHGDLKKKVGLKLREPEGGKK